MDIIQLVSKVNPVIKNWTRKDWLFFFVLVPLSVALIFVLPAEIKQFLILNDKEPTILSLFASNYTHSEIGHLLSNLLVYSIEMFILFNIETDRRRFLWMSAAIFLALPFLSSIYNVIALPNIISSQGFSSIAFAFSGYMIYSAFAYLKRRFKFLDIGFFWFLVFLDFVLFLLVNKSDLIITAGVSSIFLAYSYLQRNALSKLFRQLPPFFRQLKRDKLSVRIYRLLVFGLALFFVLSLSQNIFSVEGGSLTNILAHYVGWVFGAFVPPFLLEPVIGFIRRRRWF